MRLLLELQNYFRSLIPSTGASPESPESVILCFLSFPEISLQVDQSSAFDEGDAPGLLGNERRNEYSILLGERLKISLSVPLCTSAY